MEVPVVVESESARAFIRAIPDRNVQTRLGRIYDLVRRRSDAHVMPVMLFLGVTGLSLEASMYWFGAPLLFGGLAAAALLAAYTHGYVSRPTIAASNESIRQEIARGDGGLRDSLVELGTVDPQLCEVVTELLRYF